MVKRSENYQTVRQAGKSFWKVPVTSNGSIPSSATCGMGCRVPIRNYEDKNERLILTDNWKAKKYCHSKRAYLSQMLFRFFKPNLIEKIMKIKCQRQSSQRKWCFVISLDLTVSQIVSNYVQNRCHPSKGVSETRSSYYIKLGMPDLNTQIVCVECFFLVSWPCSFIQTSPAMKTLAHMVIKKSHYTLSN